MAESHRYWRIYVTALQRAGLAWLQAIGMATSTSGGITNLVVNIADASASSGATTVASDGSINWVSATTAVPCWWAYDFGTPFAISYVTFFPDVSPPGLVPPASFDLQYSDDNLTWTTVESFTVSGSGGEQDFLLPPPPTPAPTFAPVPLPTTPAPVITFSVFTLDLFPAGTTDYTADACSADGSVVFGSYSDSEGTSHTYRWTAASGVVPLVEPSGATSSGTCALMYNPNNNSLHVCSADGSVVAGWFAMSDGSSHGYYWTVAGGMVDLGANVGPVGLSANGSTTFGSHLVPNGSGGFNTGGFVWTPTGGLVDLGVDAYSPQYCSDDGFIVFGATSYSYWSAHSGQEFFRWTATGGVEFLPLSNVVGCTADGAKLAVSSSVWSEAGVTNLPGLPDVSGDTNITLYGISADGTTVFGTDPTDADNEASIYDVPCIWVDGVVSALPLGSATPGFDRGWQPWYCSANGAVILGASTDNTGALVAGTLSAGCVVVGGNLVILPVPTDSVQIIPQQIAADGKTAVGNSYNGNNFSGVIWRFSFASAAPAVPPPPPAAAVVNQGDIALVWDAANGRADFAMNATGTDLLLDQGLYTAVVVSLFCDRLADAADTIPDGTTDRRGWWGDTPSSEGRAVRAIPNAPDPAAAHGLTGSRLWLLARALQLPETLRQAESYAQEALQWMIDDGVAGSVTASASFPATPPNALELSITIEQDDSSQTFAVALASS